MPHPSARLDCTRDHVYCSHQFLWFRFRLMLVFDNKASVTVSSSWWPWPYAKVCINWKIANICNDTSQWYDRLTIIDDTPAGDGKLLCALCNHIVTNISVLMHQSILSPTTPLLGGNWWGFWLDLNKIFAPIVGHLIVQDFNWQFSTCRLYELGSFLKCIPALLLYDSIFTVSLLALITLTRNTECFSNYSLFWLT